MNSIEFSAGLYSFEVKEDKNEDISIIVKGKNYQDTPGLFISKEHCDPSEGKHDKSCGALEVDICELSHENIKKGNKVYLQVTCENDCSYSLSIKW